MSDERWMLPRLGEFASAETAINAVKHLLGIADMSGGDTSERTPGEAVEPTELERELWALVGAQAHLSTLLLRMFMIQMKHGGRSMDPEKILDTILRDQRTRRDLELLDDGFPFDA